MSEVLVVRNVPHEGPGLVGQVLAEAGIAYTVVDLEGHDPFPDPSYFNALIVLGGPGSADDYTANTIRLIGQIKVALDTDTPFLGSGLGFQTAVKAAGGMVMPCKEPEIGLLDGAGDPYALVVTAEGMADPLLAGLPFSSELFQLHRETVALTPNMVLLAANSQGSAQIVRLSRDGHAYGIQPPLEFTQEMLGVWAVQDPALWRIGSDPIRNMLEAQKKCNSIGSAVLTNFLNIAIHKPAELL
jgi:GMP synthase (glutamine-hydrolysing)